MDSANIACSRSASLPARLSPSPLPPRRPPHPAPPLMVMALMTEETKRRHGGVEGAMEMEKFGRGNREEGGNGKMRNAGK